MGTNSIDEKEGTLDNRTDSEIDFDRVEFKDIPAPVVATHLPMQED